MSQDFSLKTYKTHTSPNHEKNLESDVERERYRQPSVSC